MEDETQLGYLYIPAATWWGLRNRLKQSWSGPISVGTLARMVGIPETSAKNVLKHFKTVGLLDDSGKPTDRANRWRNDADYASVCNEIRKEVYPDELLNLFPDADADQNQIKDWFKRALKAGEDKGRKMASFYALLLDADANKSPDVSQKAKKVTPKPTGQTPARNRRVVTSHTSEATPTAPLAHGNGAQASIPPKSVEGLSLHIDIQIHISPEASADQIDKIFESMAKHLPMQK